MFVVFLFLCACEEPDVFGELTETLGKVREFISRARVFFRSLAKSRYFLFIESIRKSLVNMRNEYLLEHKEPYIRHNSKVDRTRTRWYYEMMKDSEEIELPKEKEEKTQYI